MHSQYRIYLLCVILIIPAPLLLLMRSDWLYVVDIIVWHVCKRNNEMHAAPIRSVTGLPETAIIEWISLVTWSAIPSTSTTTRRTSVPSSESTRRSPSHGSWCTLHVLSPWSSHILSKSFSFSWRWRRRIGDDQGKVKVRLGEGM